MAIVGSESICVDYENFHDSETATWIGKTIPNSAYQSYNLPVDSIAFREVNCCRLMPSLIDALENHATQNEAHLKTNFLKV